jgi:hypothetical protein
MSVPETPFTDPAAAAAPELPPADPLSIAATVPVTPTSRVARGAALFAAAFLLCLLAYLLVSVPGPWFPAASPQAWGAKDLTVARGTGSVIGDEVILTALDPTGNGLVTLNTSFKSADYAAVAWIVIDLPEDADVRLFWRNDYRPDKLNSLPIVVESGRTLPLVVAKDPAWIGRVTGLALAVRGAPIKPIRMRGVVVKPMGMVEVLRDRADEWLAFEGWTGTSINTITGGADVQELPLPLLLAAALLVSVGGTALWRRFRPNPGGTPIAGMLVATFVAAWFLLDARWAWNLARQSIDTARNFAGKDIHEKRLVMADGPLYAFVERARALMPVEPARVFVVADAPYFRNRAAYHLYPHNVFAEPIRNTLPAATWLRPGDWLVVAQRRGIQFDPAQQKLRWDTNQQVSAEVKLIAPDYALFRIL